jgi:hypothetical protein
MEPKGLRLQEPTTGPYPELDESEYEHNLQPYSPKE